MKQLLTWVLPFVLLCAGCGDDNERRAGTRPTPTSAVAPTATQGGTMGSPTPTATPLPPQITHLGVARADDIAQTPDAIDAEGRPIYLRLLGQGMSLIVEAQPGARGPSVGVEAFDSSGGLPDLQILVSRPLGNGSPAVCDFEPVIGGVPGTDPPEFSDALAVIDAINDLGCRVNDGTGAPFGRLSSNVACTQSDDPSGFGFGFIDPRSTIQFCLPIARAWAFPAGDTVVVARVRDVGGTFSEPEEIVIRVTQGAALGTE